MSELDITYLGCAAQGSGGEHLSKKKCQAVEKLLQTQREESHACRGEGEEYRSDRTI